MKACSCQEEVKQDIKEKLVHVDFDQRKVFVDLPFEKDPVKVLVHCHKTNNKVYQQQVRKSVAMKVMLRIAHQDLVLSVYEETEQLGFCTAGLH